jgi:tetratricopeptide (TPR) repeat protein
LDQYREFGEEAAGEDLYRESIERWVLELGDDSYGVAALRWDLAESEVVLKDQEALFTKALAAFQTAYASEPSVLVGLHEEAANTLLRAGNLDAASSQRRQALALLQRVVVPTHPIIGLRLIDYSKDLATPDAPLRGDEFLRQAQHFFLKFRATYPAWAGGWLQQVGRLRRPR